MNDIESITILDKLLEKFNFNWLDKDLETLQDDDYGERIEFYVYYEEPNIPKNIDLSNIINLFNEKKESNFKLTELVLTKNNELRAKLFDKNITEEQVLFY